jgi:hypothetical protein
MSDGGRIGTPSGKLVDGAGGLAVAIAFVIGGAILLPVVALAWFVWKWAKRRGRSGWWAVLAVPIGVLAGLYLAFFVIFDDLGDAWLNAGAAPAIEVVVPNDLRGRIYIYFDKSQPPMKPLAPKTYRIELPPGGRIVVGLFDRIERGFAYATFEFKRVDGTRLDAILPDGVGSSTKDGRTLWHRTFFIGTYEESRADYALRERAGRLFDEELVYREMQMTPRPAPTR